MEKMTYRQAIAVAIDAVKDNAEVVEKLKALDARLAKKSSGEKKPTKTQKENEILKNEILNAMNENQIYTVTELYKMFDGSVSSPQKMSALIRQLKDSGLVVRTEEKGRAYFTKAC